MVSSSATTDEPQNEYYNNYCRYDSNGDSTDGAICQFRLFLLPTKARGGFALDKRCSSCQEQQRE